MEKAFSHLRKKENTREISKKIWKKGRALFIIKMEIFIRGSGKITLNKGKGVINSQMGKLSRGCLKKENLKKGNGFWKINWFSKEGLKEGCLREEVSGKILVGIKRNVNIYKKWLRMMRRRKKSRLKKEKLFWMKSFGGKSRMKNRLLKKKTKMKKMRRKKRKKKRKKRRKKKRRRKRKSRKKIKKKRRNINFCIMMS